MSTTRLRAVPRIRRLEAEAARLLARHARARARAERLRRRGEACLAEARALAARGGGDFHKWGETGETLDGV